MAGSTGGLSTLPNGNQRTVGGGSGGPYGNDWENYKSGTYSGGGGNTNNAIGSPTAGGSWLNGGGLQQHQDWAQMVRDGAVQAKSDTAANAASNPNPMGEGIRMWEGEGTGGGLTADQIAQIRQGVTQGVRQDGGVNNAQASNTYTPYDMSTPIPEDFNVNTAAAQGVYNAGGVVSAEAGYQPDQIGAPTQQELGQYTNPYEDQVVQQSLADLERTRLMTQNTGGAYAGNANAFGGSRHGVADAETNRAYADQVARTTSGLRQTGYDNAQKMARDAQISNQAAGLQGSQNRQAAARQLGEASNLGFGMGQKIQDRMDTQGQMQQDAQQKIINAAKAQMEGFTGAPEDSLQYLLKALGAAPNVSSTTEGYTPGLFDYLSLGAGIK